jgi:hypothetical protein
VGEQKQVISKQAHSVSNAAEVRYTSAAACAMFAEQRAARARADHGDHSHEVVFSADRQASQVEASLEPVFCVFSDRIIRTALADPSRGVEQFFDTQLAQDIARAGFYGAGVSGNELLGAADGATADGSVLPNLPPSPRDTTDPHPLEAGPNQESKQTEVSWPAVDLVAEADRSPRAPQQSSPRAPVPRVTMLELSEDGTGKRSSARRGSLIALYRGAAEAEGSGMKEAARRSSLVFGEHPPSSAGAHAASTAPTEAAEQISKASSTRVAQTRESRLRRGESRGGAMLKRLPDVVQTFEDTVDRLNSLDDDDGASEGSEPTVLVAVRDFGVPSLDLGQLLKATPEDTDVTWDGAQSPPLEVTPSHDAVLPSGDESVAVERDEVVEPSGDDDEVAEPSGVDDEVVSSPAGNVGDIESPESFKGTQSVGSPESFRGPRLSRPAGSPSRHPLLHRRMREAGMRARPDGKGGVSVIHKQQLRAARAFKRSTRSEIVEGEHSPPPQARILDHPEESRASPVLAALKERVDKGPAVYRMSLKGWLRFCSVLRQVLPKRPVDEWVAPVAAQGQSQLPMQASESLGTESVPSVHQPLLTLATTTPDVDEFSPSPSLQVSLRSSALAFGPALRSARTEGSPPLLTKRPDPALGGVSASEERISKIRRTALLGGPDTGGTLLMAAGKDPSGLHERVVLDLDKHAATALYQRAVRTGAAALDVMDFVCACSLLAGAIWPRFSRQDAFTRLGEVLYTIPVVRSALPRQSELKNQHGEHRVVMKEVMQTGESRAVGRPSTDATSTRVLTSSQRQYSRAASRHVLTAAMVEAESTSSLPLPPPLPHRVANLPEHVRRVETPQARGAATVVTAAPGTGASRVASVSTHRHPPREASPARAFSQARGVAEGWSHHLTERHEVGAPVPEDRPISMSERTDVGSKQSSRDLRFGGEASVQQRSSAPPLSARFSSLSTAGTRSLDCTIVPLSARGPLARALPDCHAWAEQVNAHLRHISDRVAERQPIVSVDSAQRHVADSSAAYDGFSRLFRHERSVPSESNVKGAVGERIRELHLRREETRKLTEAEEMAEEWDGEDDDEEEGFFTEGSMAPTRRSPGMVARIHAADRYAQKRSRALFQQFCKLWGGPFATTLDADGFIELCRKLRLIAGPGGRAGPEGGVTEVGAEQIFLRCKGMGASLMGWREFQRGMTMIGERIFPGSKGILAWLRIRQIISVSTAFKGSKPRSRK